MAHKMAAFFFFTFILSVSLETGNAWKFMKRNKTPGSNTAWKVKRADVHDQNWVEEAINAGCTPHNEPCKIGTFCCPASNGKFGICERGKDGHSRCEYVIVDHAGSHSQGPVGLN
ncbi:uncharacterized protein LOC144862297 [Branchiostoma floridae x Branchiostoma japonicum]